MFCSLVGDHWTMLESDVMTHSGLCSEMERQQNGEKDDPFAGLEPRIPCLPGSCTTIILERASNLRLMIRGEHSDHNTSGTPSRSTSAFLPNTSRDSFSTTTNAPLEENFQTNSTVESSLMDGWRQHLSTITYSNSFDFQTLN